MTNQNAIAKNFGILRRDQVVAMTGYSYSSIMRKEKEGTFPRHVKLGDRAIGWRLVDVESWIDDLEPSNFDGAA